MVLHSGRLRLYPQTLDLAGKAGKKSLLQTLVDYGRKKYCNIGSWSRSRHRRDRGRLGVPVS